MTAKEFIDADRYEYPGLDHESTVIDLGGFNGDWFKAMSLKYGSRFFVFEPISDFNDRCRRAVVSLPQPNRERIQLSMYAVGGQTREERWHIKGDMTGHFNKENEETDRVIIIDVNKLLDTLPLPPVIDLIKINIEGMEFEVLEALIESGRITRFKNIQVQPHAVFPRASERWAFIDSELQKTHELKYHKEWVWSGYTLRT